ncbi:MAG: hypothetical protein HDS25_00850 [Bacteroides sp.]|nr:hypothetical protein [Bacteroides sp.]
MVRIDISGIPLDLPKDFSISIEETSPIFNDRGSQSVPATIALTRRNSLALGIPYRIDSIRDPNRPMTKAAVVDGARVRRGLINVTEASRSAGITFNIGFDNSEAYASWESMSLRDLKTPAIPHADHTPGGWLNNLARYYADDPEIEVDGLAIFPLAVGKASVSTGSGDNEQETEYWEILNVPRKGQDFSQPGTVKRVVDGALVDVNIPPGYGVTPFLRVWKVLELVFGDLGLKVLSNPFREDPDLRRLVVLNNTVDAICSGTLHYTDLMPDCTVDEFLNALYVRFGMVCRTDFMASTVDIRLIRDILEEPAGMDLSGNMTAPEEIEFQGSEYITLSAATSIEGAAPLTERFEDFSRGVDMTHIGRGTNVANWRNKGTTSSPRWDGDLGNYDDDYDPDRDGSWEKPDGWDDDRDDWWDDDRDDGRDYATRSEAPEAVGISAAGLSETDPADDSSATLARECVTGQWYLLDGRNGRVRKASSSYFKWDPQTPGMSPVDLESVDECVPVVKATTHGKTGWPFLGNCPAYLFGCRHLHSYIKESGETEDTADSTPLAFMFAYTSGGTTIGRAAPETDSGKLLRPDDGTTPRLTLYFQFRDGLFANFWSRYDEILRHDNRIVTLPARLTQVDMDRISGLHPLLLRGVWCLFDSASYSLPAGREIETEVKLRAIMPGGNYNIEAEQGIAPVSVIPGE